MTELEWLESADRQKMLELLRDRGSDRKVRLFCVACCRRIWHLLAHQTSRKAVDVAEQYSDGEVSAQDLWVAHDDAQYYSIMAKKESDHAIDAAIYTASPDSFLRDKGCFTTAPNATWVAHSVEEATTSDTIYIAAQINLIHCIFGNPFRPITLDRSHLTSTVLALAQAIYDERAFDRLPILADALEEAGITQPDLLNHCRQSGEHARGCWVVDLILAKS